MIGTELAQDTVGASWEGGRGLGLRQDVALVRWLPGGLQGRVGGDRPSPYWLPSFSPGQMC